VDLTGYYFPDYPNVPADDYIYALKRKAFLLGLDISGTGVRNDFANPDENKRKEDIIPGKKMDRDSGEIRRTGNQNFFRRSIGGRLYLGSDDELDGKRH
jgi:hypothetical protein